MNRRSSLFWITASCLALLSPQLLHAEDGVELKRHWKVGKKYHRMVRVDQELRMAYNGSTMVQKVVTEMDTSETVSPGADGKGKRIALKYERVLMEVDQDGKKSHFDSSEANAEGPPNRVFEASSKLVGRQFILTVSDQDEILGLEKGDTDFDPGRLESLLEMMKRSGLQSLPGHPVKPGDQWPFETKVNLPQFGKATIKGAYTMQRMTEHDGVPCAEVGIQGVFDLDVDKDAKPGSIAGNMERLGTKLQSASMKGSLWFDPKLGTLRDSRIEQQLNAEMKDPKNPEAATITFPIKQVITAKLSKLEDVK